MKKLFLCFLFIPSLVRGATFVTAGTNIPGYPYTNFLAPYTKFIIADTNTLFGLKGTNFNINFIDLSNIVARSLATTSYVNQATSGFVTITAYEVLTNSIRASLGTNQNWVNIVTADLVGTTLNLGLHLPAITNTLATTNYVLNAVTNLAGTTNFINLSVQAAKLPSTNYPGIDAGWQDWETIYYETNAEGSRVNLEASWQFMVPPDYATNSMQLLINYSLLGTNGPNTSNVIFGVSCLAIRSGTTNNVHTNLFGSTAWGTNNWIAKYDGTNIVTNLVISLGTNSGLKAYDLNILKLTRDALNDTYGGAAAVHGLQLIYTRQ